MAVFTDLERRCTKPPFDRDAYDRRISGCKAVAERIALVHVSGRERGFDVTIQTPPHKIPTSIDPGYCSDDTRRAERLLGLPNSAYFYAGRAHPAFGNVALAFGPGCEAAHTGSATPFDTGGLVHPDRHIRLRLNPSDGEVERIAYGRESEIRLEDWREVFGRVLAAYFDSTVDYWTGRPRPRDPEGLYELNTDCRSWTFEVRFSEGQSIFDRVAWCADEPTMETLRRLLNAQDPPAPGDPPTALDRFFQGPAALEPLGTPDFCDHMHQWVRNEVTL